MSRMAKVTEMFERVAFKIISFKYIMVIKSAFVTLMPVGTYSKDQIDRKSVV